jgi:hypothetical protein
MVGNLKDACSPTNLLYGDGECWEGYQIDCQGGYSIYDTQITYYTLVNGDFTLLNCLEVCQTDGAPYTAVELYMPFGSGGFQEVQCYCLNQPTDLRVYKEPGQQSFIASLTYCGLVSHRGHYPAANPLRGM